jgi:hypothetical protein
MKEVTSNEVSNKNRNPLLSQIKRKPNLQMPSTIISSNSYNSGLNLEINKLI